MQCGCITQARELTRLGDVLPPTSQHVCGCFQGDSIADAIVRLSYYLPFSFTRRCPDKHREKRVWLGMNTFFLLQSTTIHFEASVMSLSKFRGGLSASNVCFLARWPFTLMPQGIPLFLHLFEGERYRRRSRWTLVYDIIFVSNQLYAKTAPPFICPAEDKLTFVSWSFSTLNLQAAPGISPPFQSRVTQIRS